MNTLFDWRHKYAGMSVSDVQRPWVIDDENRRLKQFVADQVLDIVIIDDITTIALKSKMTHLATNRVMRVFLSERRVCLLADTRNSSYRRERKEIADNGLRDAIKGIGEKHSKQGYCRISGFLDQALVEQAKPLHIRCDNGPEFLGKVPDQCCYQNAVDQLFIKPGKPTENCLIENFNGTFTEE